MTGELPEEATPEGEVDLEIADTDQWASIVIVRGGTSETSG